jgi:release factor glutamine methyltransferase
MRRKIFIIFFSIIISIEVRAEINLQAENHINKVLSSKVPYTAKVGNAEFIIRNNSVCPPGRLTEMFIEYLKEQNLIKNKTIIDLGARCFGLGILAAKQGAKKVVGIEINEDAVACAKENILLNKVTHLTQILSGDTINPLLIDYHRKFDLLVTDLPGDSISKDDYDTMPLERKLLSRAFYDIEDQLILDILSRGSDLLSKNGRAFITLSSKTIDRIKKLCLLTDVDYKVVKEKDLYNDGNIYYIVELFFQKDFFKDNAITNESY